MIDIQDALRKYKGHTKRCRNRTDKNGKQPPAGYIKGRR